MTPRELSQLSFAGALCLMASTTFGAVGDIRRIISPQPGASQHFCAVGLAFDGAALYTNRCSDPLIYRVSPLDGALLASFDPHIPEWPAAMAFDTKRNGLWIGTQNDIGSRVFQCESTGMPIYFWNFDDDSVDLRFVIPHALLNPLNSQRLFSVCFLDGLAYRENDPLIDTDDELWFSDTVGPASHNIGVFRPDGTLVRGIVAMGKGGTVVSNNTGLSLGVDYAYSANNGSGDVFRANMFDDPFVFGQEFLNGIRWEADMECDAVTFSPVHVMWVRSDPQGNPTNDVITAYEVEEGECGAGPPLGACCDPMTVACRNNVSESSCSGTWVQGATCPQVSGCEAHMVVLLDRTGSMNAIRCATGNTRCFDALEAAKMDVDQFLATHSVGSSLAVWTFANAGPVNLTGGFVADAAVAKSTLTALDGVPCSGWTPLAESMCNAVDSMVAAFPSASPDERILAVSSDGEENFSDANCAGPDSMNGDSCVTYDAGSWQKQVCNRIIGNGVAQVRHWGTFGGCEGAAAAGTDTETGLLRGGGVPDAVFFESLATATGGTYLFFEDALPPSTGTPAFGVVGACCLPNGNCQESITEAECAVLGGTHQGENSTCASATGACCLSVGSCQNATTQTACTSMGGTFQGTCAICNAHVAGACCLPDQTCQDGLTPSECDAQKGTHQGGCTECTGEPGECPTPIPTVSEWGVVVMSLLVLGCGTIILGQRRRGPTLP